MSTPLQATATTPGGLGPCSAEVASYLKLGDFLEVRPHGKLFSYGQEIVDDGPTATALRAWAKVFEAR